MYQETAATGWNRLERELFVSVLNMHVTKIISNEQKKTYFGIATALMAKFLDVPSCCNVCSS